MWFGFLIAVFCLYFSDNSQFYIAPTLKSDENIGENGDYGGLNFQIPSLSNIVNSFSFSIPSIVFFAIIAICFGGIVINKELKNGQIVFWMTASFSRYNIIASKIIFVLIVMSLIYVPAQIPLIVFAALAVDGQDYWRQLLCNILDFWLFILLLGTLFTMILVIFDDNTTLSFGICGMIVVYMLVTWLFISLSETNPSQFSWAKYLKYVSLQSLFIDLLRFSPPIVDTTTPVFNVLFEVLEKINPLRLGLSITINLLIIMMAFFGSCLVFNNKNLKI